MTVTASDSDSEGDNALHALVAETVVGELDFVIVLLELKWEVIVANRSRVSRRLNAEVLTTVSELCDSESQYRGVVGIMGNHGYN